MRLLLDTQILLWALSGDRRLDQITRKTLTAPDNEVFVSAASLWEIAIKSSIGKLEADVLEVLAAVPASGFQELPVTGRHAADVAALPWLHRDPFDRLLVAQARAEPMRLLTADETLRQYGDFVILAG
jgi:PIN domain nuclease of toxin-antitoxin system